MSRYLRRRSDGSTSTAFLAGAAGALAAAGFAFSVAAAVTLVAVLTAAVGLAFAGVACRTPLLAGVAFAAGLAAGAETAGLDPVAFWIFALVASDVAAAPLAFETAFVRPLTPGATGAEGAWAGVTATGVGSAVSAAGFGLSTVNHMPASSTTATRAICMGRLTWSTPALSTGTPPKLSRSGGTGRRLAALDSIATCPTSASQST